ncbi:hypothetical protein ABZ958_03230 [Streptomyces sp. NPDC046237]|uniref:hypothetical protein n=1 Tax=Streptomyces sp. NPDC046237 TaxID=3154914 RepID=UPI0033CC9663
MTTSQNLADRRSYRRKALRKQQGLCGLIDAAQVAAHIQLCIDAGWTRLGIAEASQVSDRSIRYILAGQPTVQRDNARRILAVNPEASPFVPPIGTIRRIKALARAGYTIRWTADRAGCSNRHIYEILNGTVEAVDRILAERFADIYRRHEGTPGPSNPARIAARTKDWAGPDGWDSDTIDDPEAAPDWTGFCGTDRGWWTHRLQQIAMCPRCEDAHTAWLQDHKHLSGADRWKAVAAARAVASNRRAAIAEDANELMRTSGLDRATAAIRLGVSKAYIDHAFRDHPQYALDTPLYAQKGAA